MRSYIHLFALASLFAAGIASGTFLPISSPAQEKEKLLTKSDEVIKNLIACLADVKDPYYGLSPSLSGRAFAAVAGSEKIDVMLLTNHGLKTPEPVKRLVQLGPVALPYLLKALDDKTPTKLKIEPNGMTNWGFPEKGPYVVKVGDISYVAIGQIIGRPYKCVSYIPSGIILVSSPCENKDLVKELRAEWSNKESSEQLREKLLKDYETKPKFNGKSLDGWYEGSNLQIEAIMRLLYYCSKQSVPLVVARLKSFDVADPGKEIDAWIQREARNGVRTVDFIKAVAWSEDPDIRSALVDIAKRTNDKTISEALSGIGATTKKP
jgi:hypothetical protein